MQATSTYFSSILEKTAMDNSTASVDYAEYRTSELNISSTNTQTGEYYQIVIKDTDQWLLMSKAYLQVRVRIVRTDDTAIADTNAYVGTLNAAGASLFSHIELMANGAQIDRVDNPQFVQLVNCLTEYSKDKLASVAEAEWLQLDFARGVMGPQDVTGTLVGTEQALAINSPEFTGVSTQVWDKGDGCAVIKQMARGRANDATTSGGEHPLFNGGFLSRWNRTRYGSAAGGREFEIMIPLASVLGFCRDIQHVVRGVQLELNLQKNTRYSSIMHGSGLVYGTGGAVSIAACNAIKPLITKISLWVPQITPSLETVSMLEAALSESVVSKQYFENMTCRFSSEMPAGTVDFEELLSLEGHKPVKIYFGFQRQAQYNTQNDIAMMGAAGVNSLPLQLMCETHSNGSTFSTLTTYTDATKSVSGGITEVELRINTKSLPREKYRISFSDASPEYERVYADFLKSSGKYQDESGSAVSFKDYKNLYPLFAFDLRDYADIFSGLKNNDIRFRARISGGSPTAFRMVYIVYSERELVVQPISNRLSLKV